MMQNRSELFFVPMHLKLWQNYTGNLTFGVANKKTAQKLNLAGR